MASALLYGWGANSGQARSLGRAPSETLGRVSRSSVGAVVTTQRLGPLPKAKLPQLSQSNWASLYKGSPQVLSAFLPLRPGEPIPVTNTLENLRSTQGYPRSAKVCPEQLYARLQRLGRAMLRISWKRP